MPVLALAGPVASALGASAGTAGLIGGVGTVAGGLLTANQAKDAGSAAAAKAGTYTPVDINALNQQVQQQSQSNAALSNALEQQYNPYINALRQSSASALAQYLNPSSASQTVQSDALNAINGLARGYAAPAALTNAANSANAQLGLGGNLDQETQNAVMRAGAAQGGMLAGPGGGLGLGRDVSARDLGLTSLQLLQQRQNAAAGIGSQLGQYNLGAQAGQIAGLNSLGGLANQIGQQQFGNVYGITGLTQGIGMPQVGLSPASVAGIAVGNSNMANNANQNSAAIQSQQANSMGSLGGGLLGMGLNNLSQVNWGSNPTTTSGSGGNWIYNPSNYSSIWTPTQ